MFVCVCVWERERERERERENNTVQHSCLRDFFSFYVSLRPRSPTRQPDYFGHCLLVFFFSFPPAFSVCTFTDKHSLPSHIDHAFLGEHDCFLHIISLLTRKLGYNCVYKKKKLREIKKEMNISLLISIRDEKCLQSLLPPVACMCN